MRPSLALSTLWNSHRHRDGYFMLQEIRKLGFPGAELSASLEEYHWDGIYRAADRNLIRLVSMSLPAEAWSDDKLTEFAFNRAHKAGVPIIVLGPMTPKVTATTSSLLRLYKRGHFLERDFVSVKLAAVKRRPSDISAASEQWFTRLSSLVNLARMYKLRLAVETTLVYESFPQEDEELESALKKLPAEVGYWHDFGHAARKDFLAWHTHGETLGRWADRLLGYHVHDCRRPDEDHLPLSHGDIEFAPLLPLTQNTVAVLELGPKTPDEQVLSSRHLWHSYVETSA